MKAYSVVDHDNIDDDGNACLVFATSNIEARRIGANELGRSSNEWSGLEVKRKPAADMYWRSDIPHPYISTNDDAMLAADLVPDGYEYCEACGDLTNKHDGDGCASCGCEQEARIEELERRLALITATANASKWATWAQDVLAIAEGRDNG